MIRKKPKMSNYPVAQYYKDDPKAVDLVRAHPTDTGIDLTMIKLVKDKKQTDNMIYLDSGIIVQPHDTDHYFELVPRSSFAKKAPGWVMVNSPGIIDTNYRGTLQVCLQRFDKSDNKIILPLNAFQLIYRKIEPCNIQRTEKFSTKTDRGQGGFGSTDNNSTIASGSKNGYDFYGTK